MRRDRCAAARHLGLLAAPCLRGKPWRTQLPGRHVLLDGSGRECRYECRGQSRSGRHRSGPKCGADAARYEICPGSFRPLCPRAARQDARPRRACRQAESGGAQRRKRRRVVRDTATATAVKAAPSSHSYRLSPAGSAAEQWTQVLYRNARLRSTHRIAKYKLQIMPQSRCIDGEMHAKSACRIRGRTGRARHSYAPVRPATGGMKRD